MGSSSFSRDDYAARSTLRSNIASSLGISKDAATYAHDHDVRMGRASGVHASLNPKTGKKRECRDSAAHPISVPIGILLDTTGSMAEVPKMIQAALPKLMGCFLDDKASGKKYLGEGYPAIMISAVDDYDAMGGGEGTLQAGQFESGLEIDDNLTNLLFTGRGGGTYQESYELGLYFFAHNTVHDHMEKRGRKGHLFIIGDEKAYDVAAANQIKEIMGMAAQADVPFAEVVAAAKELYNVFFVIPNMTGHYADPVLERFWVSHLGQQNVLKLKDPSKICELIVSAVAICEEHIGVDDISKDLGVDCTALAPLSKGQLAKVSAAGLPAVTGTTGGNDRL